MAFTYDQDYVSLDKTREILYSAKTACPAVVLGVFLLGFITYGIVNAPSEDAKVEVRARRGPGGRPLPLRRKSARQVKEAVKVTDFSPNSKLIFKAISAGVLVSFVANGAAIILQVLNYRDDRWWPGQSAVVSLEHENECPADMADM
jgi:ATP-binding cassette, subfamily B, vacuolar membrane transporter HMT1/ACLQ